MELSSISFQNVFINFASTHADEALRLPRAAHTRRHITFINEAETVTNHIRLPKPINTPYSHDLI